MAKRRSIDEMISFKLRMPEGLRQKLEAEAEKAERSINSEILWRLGHTFNAEWQGLIAEVEKREKELEEFRERMMQSPELQKIVGNLIAKHPPDKKGK
jgi:predicted metal-dependent peptidase